MLFGVGCDLCEIARMEQSLFGPHGEAFEARVFGEAERQALALDSCREAPKKAKNDHGDTVRQSALNVSRRAHKAASAAADFAAKEAFLKAAGTGLRQALALPLAGDLWPRLAALGAGGCATAGVFLLAAWPLGLGEELKRMRGTI